MSWFNRIFKREEKSSSIAKTRLQMVLTHDREDISPGLIELIKDDIIDVIAKHLAVDAESVEINLTRTQSESRLVAEVPLQSNGRRS